MTHRELLEIDEGFRTPFWRFLKKHLTEKAEDLRKSAGRNIPETPGEVIQREQMFGAANAFDDLIDLLPKEVARKCQEQLEAESKTS